MNDGQIVSALLSLIACFMIACRIDKMVRGVTLSAVFYQHAALAAGLFGSFLLTFTRHADWSTASVVAGVVVFLTLSVQRWRHGAPEGTTRPADLQDTRPMEHQT